MDGKKAPKGAVRRSERSELKERMKSFLMFLPNLFTLLLRLIRDPRVPKAEKALFGAAIVYVISPLDFIPDVFPFIGQVDDLYVVVLCLLRLINRTDDSVVRELWQGRGDIVVLADTIAGLAPRFLPRRIARVITSRVEMAPVGKIVDNIKTRKAPVIKEIAADETSVLEPGSAMAN